MPEKNNTSYPKEKINILFLENISDVAVKQFSKAGYTNVKKISAAINEADLVVWGGPELEGEVDAGGVRCGAGSLLPPNGLSAPQPAASTATSARLPRRHPRIAWLRCLPACSRMVRT